MKARLASSIAIGALASMLVLALASAFPKAPWQYLGIPGHIAIILIWGPHGPINVSDTIVLAIGLAINAIIYGLIAFGILAWLGTAKLPSHNSNDEQSER